MAVMNRKFVSAFSQWKDFLKFQRMEELEVQIQENFTLSDKPAGDEDIESLLEWCNLSDLFRTLDEDSLRDCVSNFTMQVVPAGDVVVVEGDEAECYYILLTGSVLVKAGIPPLSKEEISSDRKHALKSRDLLQTNFLGNTIFKYFKGQGFGDMGLLDISIAHRSASIIAEEESVVLMCPKAVYKRSVEKFDLDATKRGKVVRWLRRSWLFHDWSRARLIGLAGKLEERQYRCRAALCSAGQTSPGLILITSGEVKVVKHNTSYQQRGGNNGQRSNTRVRGKPHKDALLSKGLPKSSMLRNGDSPGRRKHGAGPMPVQLVPSAKQDVEVALQGEGDVIGEELLVEEEPLKHLRQTSVIATTDVVEVLILPVENMRAFLSTLKTMPGTFNKLKQLRESHGEMASSRCRGVKRMRRKVRKQLQQQAVETRQQDIDDKAFAAGGDPYQFEGEMERERRLWLEKLPSKQPLRVPAPPVAISKGLMYIPKCGAGDLEYEDPRKNAAELQRERGGLPLPGSTPQRLPPFLVNEGNMGSRRNHLLMHGSSPLLPSFVQTGHTVIDHSVVSSSSASLRPPPPRLNDSLSAGNQAASREVL
jgi:CRP-like cAMP-binding protein